MNTRPLRQRRGRRDAREGLERNRRGARHTCAIKQSGMLYCWGRTAIFRSRTATPRTSTCRSLFSLRRRPSRPDADWAAVSTGVTRAPPDRRIPLVLGPQHRRPLGTQEHEQRGAGSRSRQGPRGKSREWARGTSCVRRDERRHSCWGRKSERPDPGRRERVDHGAPRDSESDTDWKDVVPGPRHTCAIKQDAAFSAGDRASRRARRRDHEPQDHAREDRRRAHVDRRRGFGETGARSGARRRLVLGKQRERSARDGRHRQPRRARRRLHGARPRRSRGASTRAASRWQARSCAQAETRTVSSGRARRRRPRRSRPS